MSSITEDRFDRSFTVSLSRKFETPQSLRKYLWEACASDQNIAPSRLLYFDIDSMQGRNYIVAIIENHDGKEWLFAEVRNTDTLSSLVSSWPALIWIERELAAKRQRRQKAHFDSKSIFQPHKNLPEPRATGSGVFTLPLGPVRADVTESAFYLFETVGEQIVHMQPQLFYKHRNIEELAQGASMTDALLLAERISGTASASHALAYVRAVEDVTEFTPSQTIQAERILFTELERLYNHAGDLSQIASAAGMTVGQAQLARVKEEILRLCADLVGSRYLHGAVRLYSGTGIEWSLWASDIERRLTEMDARLHKFVQLLLRTPTFVDRLVGTGVVTEEWAQQYGCVGPVARACGMHTDVRHDSQDLSDLGYRICVSDRGMGDAKDRFDIRVAEWEVSLNMVLYVLQNLIDALPHKEPSGSDLKKKFSTEGWGIGLAEGPRGRIAHVIYTSDDRIQHYGIRSGSAWNWPVFGLATANGNIQTDFPVIDASFGLSCAGMDR